MARNKRAGIKERFNQTAPVNDATLLETLSVKRSSKDGKVKRKSNFFDIPLNRIKTGKGQPRQNFDKASLQELADSMQVNGQIEPITVMRQGDSFLLEVGGRRYRAAKLLNWNTITAEIIEDEDTFRAASRRLIENVMREDLSSVEKANGLLDLKKLMGDDTKWAEVEKQTGISSRRRKQLLATKKLPETIQDAIIKGTIPDRSAQALLRLKTPQQQLRVFDRIATENLNSDSVRQAVTKILKKKKPPITKPAFWVTFTAETKEDLIKQLQAKIRELQQG